MWGPWPWQSRFHTSSGPRRRPCLGQGRGRRIYIYIFNWNGPQYTTNSTNMICVCPQWGIPQKGESNGGQGWSTIQMDTSTQRGHFERIKSVKKKLGLNQHGLWWLVGGLEHEFYEFPYIGNFIIPTDELRFFRGVAQPPTRYRFRKPNQMMWLIWLYQVGHYEHRWHGGTWRQAVRVMEPVLAGAVSKPNPMAFWESKNLVGGDWNHGIFRWLSISYMGCHPSHWLIINTSQIYG